MASTRTCPKCGFDLTDTAGVCPMCSIAAVARPGARIWLAALVQIAFMATFMFVFRFPKIMIAVFAVVILLFAALSQSTKAIAITARTPAPQRPLSHPTLFVVVSLAIALCGLVFISSLLFGFVTFLNSWNRWHQYEGQPYHQSDFVVKQVYFQKGLKGAVDAYASGTVEGQREWMNLIPYLHVIPRSEAQLDSMVGPGITIPIFYFPKLKGRARVQFDDGVLPSEEGRRGAMKALNYGSLGIVISAGLIFLLSRLRRMCFVPDTALQLGATVGR